MQTTPVIVIKIFQTLLQKQLHGPPIWASVSFGVYGF